MSPLRKDTVVITDQGPPNSRISPSFEKFSGVFGPNKLDQQLDQQLERRSGRTTRFERTVQTPKILNISEQGEQSEHLPSDLLEPEF